MGILWFSCSGQDATPEQIWSWVRSWGWTTVFCSVWTHFLVNAAQGEFGLSSRQGAKVSWLIAERFRHAGTGPGGGLPALAMVGVPMGVYAALKRALSPARCS